MKAEDDFEAATLLRAAEARLHDQVCFHCQQCVEKYLKALLEENHLPIPKTHNLVKLMELLVSLFPKLKSHRRGLDFLTRFAVETRYPNDFASKRQAIASLRWSIKLRLEIRTILKLKP
ncbi:MAG: HEPN domain-containing protein [Gemmatales bacterium]